MPPRQQGPEQPLQPQAPLAPRSQRPPLVECWVTGAYATVLAAASQAGAVDLALDDDHRERDVTAMPCSPRCRSSSPFSLAETVRRLESAARHHGLAVFAHLSATTPGRLGATWLVLGVDPVHTPVVRAGPHAAIELPLALHIRPHVDRASTEVEFSDSAWLADHAELPLEWTQPLAELPRVIGEALC